jgi:hypothetical protein
MKLETAKLILELLGEVTSVDDHIIIVRDLRVNSSTTYKLGGYHVVK